MGLSEPVLGKVCTFIAFFLTIEFIVDNPASSNTSVLEIVLGYKRVPLHTGFLKADQKVSLCYQNILTSPLPCQLLYQVGKVCREPTAKIEKKNDQSRKEKAQ